MKRLVAVTSNKDIFPEYRETPIGLLLEYHNLIREFESFSTAQLLISMCMDHRKRLQMPENFAYVIRTGGANLVYSEFKVSYAISVGGVNTIALMGHTNCGMVNLEDRKELFINGLVEKAGCDRQWSENHFNLSSPIFEIGDEVDFVLGEARRLRKQYPKILVAPLLYRVEDNLLYLVKEQS